MAQSIYDSRVDVSVILPVYNAEAYVGECIDSVLRQTCVNIEIVCVDDGSTDGSLSVLMNYAEKNNNVVVYSQKNAGAGAARNRGIDVSSGEYLMFIDPDDRMSSNDVIGRLLNIAKKESCPLVCGTMNYLVGTKCFPAKQYLCEKEGFVSVRDVPFCFGHTRFLYKKDLLLQNSIYYPNYRRFQDPPFLARAIVAAGGYYAVDMPVNDYRRAYKVEIFSEKKLNDYLRGVADLLRVTADNHMVSAHKHAIEKVDYWPVVKALRSSGEESKRLLVEIENSIDRSVCESDDSYLTFAGSLMFGDPDFKKIMRAVLQDALYRMKVGVFRVLFGAFDR